MRLCFRPVIGSRLPISFQRRWATTLTRIVGGPNGIERSEIWVGELSMTRLRRIDSGAVGAIDPGGRDAVLYVHGGGFEIGGGEMYVGFASWIATVTGADVYLPDYRLAPEHPQPAPTDDAFVAYRAVLELGHDPHRTAVIVFLARRCKSRSVRYCRPHSARFSIKRYEATPTRGLRSSASTDPASGSGPETSRRVSRTSVLRSARRAHRRRSARAARSRKCSGPSTSDARST